MTEQPVVPRSVRVRVFNENGDIILVLNNEKILPNKGIKDMGFSIPQGSIRPGELPEEAARRELREEAGIEVRELISVGFDQNPNGIVAEIFDGHGFIYLNGKGPSVAYESEMSGVVEARWVPLPLNDYIRADFDGNEYRIYKSTLRSLNNFPLTKPSEKIIKRAVQLRICREGGDAALVLTDGFWELPGTILDPEESALNGASRLLRELGLSVEKVRLLGEFQNIWIYECLSVLETVKKKEKMGFYAWIPTPLDEDETVQGHKASDLAIWAMEIPSPDPV